MFNCIGLVCVYVLDGKVYRVVFWFELVFYVRCYTIIYYILLLLYYYTYIYIIILYYLILYSPLPSLSSHPLLFLLQSSHSKYTCRHLDILTYILPLLFLSFPIPSPLIYLLFSFPIYLSSVLILISFYTCRYLHLLIYIQSVSQSTI